MGALALVGIYAAVGFWAAPGVIKSQLEKRLSAELRRPVRIGEVRTNPFTFSIAVSQLQVNDRDGQPFVGWQRVFVNFQPSSFFSDEQVFEEISIEGLRARLAVSKDGQLNCEDLFARKSTATKRRGLRIDRLSVGQARVDYSDHSVSTPFSTHAGPVTFSLRNFRTSGRSDAPGFFTAATDSGETLTWRGAFALAPLRSNGELSLDKIGLGKYNPYYAPVLPCDLRDGVLDLKARYNFWIEAGRPALRVTDGNLVLSNLVLGTKAPGDPALTFERVTLQDVNANSVTGVLQIPTATVAGGRIRATRDRSGLNLANLFGGASRPSAGSSSPAGDIQVGEFSLRGIAVDFEDRTSTPVARFAFSQVNANLKEFSSKNLATPRALALSARMDGGASLRVNGTLSPAPVKGGAVVELSQMPLAPFVAYLAPTLDDFRVTGGIVTATVQVDLQPKSGGSSIAVHSQGAIEELRIAGASATEPPASVKSLVFTGLEYGSAPSRLTIAEVVLNEPNANLVLGSDRKLNIRTSARAPDAKPAAISLSSKGVDRSAALQKPSLFVAVDRLGVAGGTFSFRDLSLQPNVTLAVKDLEGSLSGISNGSVARAELELRGKVNGAAPLAIKGQVSPFEPASFADLRAEVRNVDLAHLGSYAGKYLGYHVARGSLSVDARFRTSQRRMNSNITATLQHVEFGEATDSAQATRVPLTLALTLLRDASGKIVLPIPIQGSLDDPQFQIGTLVGRALENLVVKIATSPFAFIASKFASGYKGEELSFQEFQPGGVLLESASEKKLMVVARQLREAPDLHLQVEGSFDPNADPDVLREQELDRRIRQAIWQREKPMNPSISPPDQLQLKPETVELVLADFYRKIHTQPRKEESATKGPASRRWSITRIFRRAEAPPAAARGPAQEIVLPPREQLREEVLDSIPVDEAVLRQLATSRAEIVREYLVNQGEVARERIGLAAPAGKGARVELRLK